MSGINTASSISIVGGTYSINGGTYTSGVGIVTNGQTVRVRRTSSAFSGTTTTATLTIGGVNGTFSVTTTGGSDTTPNAFSFTAQTGVARSTLTTSNTITVSGINAAAPISVTGTSGQYSINGGTYTSVAGSVTNSNMVTLRRTSSASFSTLTTATLTIGGVSGAFNVTTQAIDTTPNAFSFTAQTGAALSTLTTSNTITVSGINAAAPISITGASGQYSINGGTYTSLAGTVTNGQPVTVRQTSSASNGATTTATLTIGGVSGAFNVTTNIKAVMTDPAAGSTLSSPTVIFTWNTGSGASQYWLRVGTTGAGSFNIYNASQGTGLSRSVSGLPTNGSTVYVRLWSYVAGAWQFNDYTYTAVTM